VGGFAYQLGLFTEFRDGSVGRGRDAEAAVDAHRLAVLVHFLEPPDAHLEVQQTRFRVEDVLLDGGIHHVQVDVDLTVVRRALHLVADRARERETTGEKHGADAARTTPPGGVVGRAFELRDPAPKSEPALAVGLRTLDHGLDVGDVARGTGAGALRFAVDPIEGGAPVLRVDPLDFGERDQREIVLGLAPDRNEAAAGCGFAVDQHILLGSSLRGRGRRRHGGPAEVEGLRLGGAGDGEREHESPRARQSQLLHGSLRVLEPFSDTRKELWLYRHGLYS